MSYKKVGGLHFVRIGRFGFSFFISRKKRAERVVPVTFEPDRGAAEWQSPDWNAAYDR